MADKNGKGKSKPLEGLLSSFLKPLKKHRVTLTRAGKSDAPMKKGKANKAKKAKKGAAKGVKKTKKPIALPGRHERQTNELKTLANIGKRDPERLASIITRMLMDEDEIKERERLKYERMIWRKAENYGQPPPDDGAGEGSKNNGSVE